MSLPSPPLAVVVLNRIGFGPRPGDVDAFNALGDDDPARLDNYLSEQLDPAAINDTDADQRIARASYESINLSKRATWARYVINEDQEANAGTPVEELRRLTLLRATHSKRQLVEVLADFWHNHFNLNGDQGIVRSMIMRYDRDVIRANLLGNFREMLGEVAESTCMLYYLDNYLSTDAGPNENWARELLELHTLGAENYLGAGILQSDVPRDDNDVPTGYVDDDVYEATRAFTGWTVDTNQRNNTGDFLYLRDNHDRFQKQVVGTFIQADQNDLADGNDVLDTLAAHPGTARHICGKLIARLVTEQPPEELVASAAQVFLENTDAPDQLALVTGHILRSEAFSNSFGAKVRRPFDFTAAVLRQTQTELTFDLDDGRTNSVLNLTRDMGHRLFSWPAPDGFPERSEYWLNTNSILTRWLLANELLAGSEDDRYVVDLRKMINTAVPPSNSTAENIADFWAPHVLGFPASDGTRTSLVEFMAQGFDPTFDLGNSEPVQVRTRALLALIFMSPEYVWR